MDKDLIREFILSDDYTFSDSEFCVGAVCQVCGKDIKKTQTRTIAQGSRLNWHICIECINKIIKSKEETYIMVEVQIHKQKMKKSMDEFRKRINHEHT